MIISLNKDDNTVSFTMPIYEAKALGHHLYDPYSYGQGIDPHLSYMRHWIRTSIGIHFTKEELNLLIEARQNAKKS